MAVGNNKPAWLSMGAANAAFSFLAMIVIGYALHWKARDLIWGLWFSSLCLGMLVFVAQFIVWPLIKAKNAAMYAQALFGGCFLLVFFTFHYGAFHLVHSLFLSVFFPPEGVRSLLDVFRSAEDTAPLQFGMGMYRIIVLAYWPVALITAWSKKNLFLAPQDRDRSMGVYTYVVKMHMMILLLAAFLAFKADSFWAYAGVCVFYFFPFQVIFPSCPEWLSSDFEPAADKPGDETNSPDEKG